MKIKFTTSILFLSLIVIFFIFYKGLKNSNIYTPNTSIEKNIPFFKGNIFNTQDEITSDAIFRKDQFYLINIWSSWCVPCREEHIFLINLSKKKDLKIIGLNYKDNIENAKFFLNELNSPYELIISDLDGTIAIEWGAYGVPESFLVYNKKIIKKIIGPITDQSFLEIKKLIQ